VRLIIHRGAHQVGGSCVELSSEDSSILLDLGLPLDHGFGDDFDANLPQPLFQELRQGSKKISGVLLSHAHLDHYGLAGILPQRIPVYCGEATAELIATTAQISPDKMPPFELQTFQSWNTFRIGPFSVSPYLMDHAAFDAYGFLISMGSKNVFYTGDFRGHGRKAKLLDRLVQKPPEVDVLLMEGTLLGERSNELTVSEAELEDEFVKVIEETHGIVLVTTSSQNIDRLVTIFKATRRSRRRLVLDFYTAEILERLEKYAKLPQASWPGIRVCYPQLLSQRFEELGLDGILARHRQNGIKWKRINEIRGKAVMLVRPNFLFDIKRFLDLKEATWIYSMWPGYFEKSKPLRNLKTYLADKDVRFEYLHTSGHAKLSDMKRLVEALDPEVVIPIHTFYPERYKNHFPNVRLIEDGEVFEIE
jgi:ribonuclease J